MTLLQRTLRLLFCALIVGCALPACGGGGGASALPSTVGTQNLSPSPGATPTKAPGATPSPTPSPVPSGAPATGNYYVATTGNDSNSGTISAPFKTIQHAANVATAGQTVVVEPGTYQTTSANLVLLTASGTSGNPITFISQYPLQAILDGNNDATSVAFGFNANSEGWINIEGFVMQNFLDGGIYLNSGSNGLSDANHDVVISNNHFTKIGFVGVLAAQGTYNVTISGNQIDHIGSSASSANGADDHGLYIGGSSWTITNNNFHDNDYGWDIQIDGATGETSTGYDISNNTFGVHDNINGSANPGNIVLWANTGNTASGTLEDNAFTPTVPSSPPLHCYPTGATGSPTWTITGNTGYTTSSVTDCTGMTVQQ